MKQFYLLLTAVLFCNISQSQIINIQDPNFKAILLAGPSGNVEGINHSPITVDANGDGEIQVSEAQSVYYLHLNSVSVSDLTGIEYFTNLTWLICQFNTMTSLDVSNLPNLTILDCSWGQIETLNVSGLTNLEYLGCGDNLLTTLDVNGLTNLKEFRCPNNQLTSLDVNGLTNLQRFYCGNNSIATLNISNLNTLWELHCEQNEMTSLNLSNLNEFEYLDCSSNLFTSLNVNGLTSLEWLYCDNNQLNSLNLNSLVNLKSFSCSNNQITTLNLSNSLNLEDLNCESNQMASLNITGLIHLKYLTCSDNYLTALDLTGLSGLWKVLCNSNQLTSLNVNNAPDLYELWCFDNQMTSLYMVNLPSLTDLICHNNQIESLDLSQVPNLSRFGCWNNNLTSLDFSQTTNIIEMNCGRNNLTTLDLNGLVHLDKIYCNDTPELVSVFIKNNRNESMGSFSNNPNLEYICADESQVVTIQNLITSYGYTNCHVNSYCTFTPGGTFYTIQGDNRYDTNNNGCDVNDIGYPNLKFSFTSGPNTVSLIPDVSGSYHYDVQAGTQSIQPIIENPSYFNVSPTSAVVTFPTESSPFIQDFCITANGIHNDLELFILPVNRARPGFDAHYKIIYKNKGTTIQNGTINFAFNDSILEVVLASPTTTGQSLNSLNWDFINLQPFETREIVLTLHLNSPVDSPGVNSGDDLNYIASINGAIDETPIDNSFVLNQRVVGAIDPNDKTCLEGNLISPEMVGKYVHYLIRFENTGTANAENVVVKDVIDTAKFDINTLIPLDGSHSYVTRITNLNKIEFIFENINLPFDDANNDGYVVFKIKTKPTLVLGDTFSNSANIYFDYNFPVVTNTATTTIQTLANSDFQFNNVFSLSPVPTKDTLTITTKQATLISSISIYNVLGQLVQVITNPNEDIDVSDLKSGNYFITIISDKGSATSKFIKE